MAIPRISTGRSSRLYRRKFGSPWLLVGPNDEYAIRSAINMDTRELRTCLRDPIPEIFEAAKLLDDAVTAHLEGRRGVAAQLICQMNTRSIRDWVESIWGKNTGFLPECEIITAASKNARIKQRMPNRAEKAELLKRDGYHCRFCG